MEINAFKMNSLATKNRINRQTLNYKEIKNNEVFKEILLKIKKHADKGYHKVDISIKKDNITSIFDALEYLGFSVNGKIAYNYCDLEISWKEIKIVGE